LLYSVGMYRQSPPTLVALANALDRRLSLHEFLVVEPDEAARAPEVGVVRGYHRKTWNTNRAVFLARLEEGDTQDMRSRVEVLRRESGRVFGSSWWSQLGLQIVFAVVGPPPAESVLKELVAAFNTQGILIQSLFAVDLGTLATTSARTWGQVITGPFQDAIAEAIEDVAKGRIS
jgi:hypothetical protein